VSPDQAAAPWGNVPAPTRRVQCKTCLAVADIPADTDPHARTWCTCCTEDHHHGAAAEACSPANHGGQPCWNPPAQPVKPDGCGVCRPVIHFAVAGEMQIAGPAT
jgi:hypothetical protein